MATTFLPYRLSDGYVHHWLVAGPRLLRVEHSHHSHARGDFELNILRRFFEPDSGVTEAPVDLGSLGPVTKGDPLVTWRYYRCREDHYVDFSAIHPTCSYVRAWAYAQVSVPAAKVIGLVLTTNGPADVWLNGQHLHRQDHFEKQLPRHVSIQSALQPGANELLVRFESAGVGQTPHVMALQFQGLSDSEAQIILPTDIAPELLEKRHVLETVVESASLDRYVYGFPDGDRYNRNEPVSLRFPHDLEISAKITARLQSLFGDIFQEATKACGAGTVLELATAFPLRNGPHHLALLPPAHEYYQKKIRFERKELFHVVRTPYSQRVGLDADGRVNEALEDAAQRRNGSLYCEIAKMALGRWKKLDLKTLHGAIEGVQQRREASVFDLLGLLGILLRFQRDDTQLEAIRNSLESCLINYRYWKDEDSDDVRYGGLDFSDECHQILYHTCETLAGQLLPDTSFQTSGKTGRWHKTRGEQLALAWLRQRGKYGFKNWDSPTHVEAILAALSYLVDLASSDTIRELASVLMDKIFFSLAINSLQGAYGSSRGWTDTASVLSARLEPTSGIARLMWGVGNLNENLMGTVSLACCQKYELPDVIRQIVADPMDAFWGQERHILPAGSSDGDEAGTWEVNKVTYKTRDFMLSCAQDYRPGQAGRREHIWQATLGPDAVVFVNHPTCMSEDDAHQPNLWAGNGALPRAAQWGDVLIAFYKPPSSDWLGFTHAYFPVAAFDEYRVNGPWAFCRKGKGYLALRAAQGLEFITRGPTAFRELRSVGKENVWLCHMGQALLDGSFEDFQRSLLAMEVVFDGLSMRLKTLRGDQLVFGWEGPLFVNGQEQPLAGYRHIENPFCTVDLPAAEMDIVYQGGGVRLRFE